MIDHRFIHPNKRNCCSLNFKRICNAQWTYIKDIWRDGFLVFMQHSTELHNPVRKFSFSDTTFSAATIKLIDGPAACKLIIRRCIIRNLTLPKAKCALNGWVIERNGGIQD